MVFTDIADKLPPDVRKNLDEVCPVKTMTQEEAVQAVEVMQEILRDSQDRLFTSSATAKCCISGQRECFTRGSFTVAGEQPMLRIHWYTQIKTSLKKETTKQRRTSFNKETTYTRKHTNTYGMDVA